MVYGALDLKNVHFYKKSLQPNVNSYEQKHVTERCTYYVCSRRFA